MDVSQTLRENVSQQLFTKQLPPSEMASYYGCVNDFTTPYLTTCSTQEDSTQIENAFQKQLTLSEYYKSKYVFDAVKRDYMDQTMENVNRPPVIPSPDVNPPPERPPPPPQDSFDTVLGKRQILTNPALPPTPKPKKKGLSVWLYLLVILISLIFGYFIYIS